MVVLIAALGAVTLGFGLLSLLLAMFQPLMPGLLVWGNLVDLSVETDQVTLEESSLLACRRSREAYLFDTLRPDPGQVDFYLVRESGEGSYGPGVSGLPRLPAVEICP